MPVLLWCLGGQLWTDVSCIQWQGPREKFRDNAANVERGIALVQLALHYSTSHPVRMVRIRDSDLGGTFRDTSCVLDTLILASRKCPQLARHCSMANIPWSMPVRLVSMD
ncbi:hypothetical protein BO70DRAFT_364095 [Aspergillus heteromorphus CBS 117.55]|uniref:Heterokaryon incompatibility domain-containing protein n=1 Tax=Aspergillus heteromorphus CBS 117.55 TaxID=1448321 RepID=A0A317VSV4_9EURO|nr:uncharacterized protein BO70DRAFT_364095 [Aspergillus heteromorphus CBS 117.55]PWY75000.1 hypothetical protein BO70DRAFT_364095 [Aspergillus heteromorphus CBS 117.55]